jgi:hypothetical protein
VTLERLDVLRGLGHSSSSGTRFYGLIAHVLGAVKLDAPELALYELPEESSPGD